MIGTATAADGAAIVALWHAAGVTRPWNDPAADFAATLACPTATVLAARANGGITGTIMAGWDGHRGWLYYLAVADGQRRRGLGRALVAAAEAWLAGHGAPKVQLMVRTGNACGEAFWTALGYARGEVAVFGRPLP